jgi:hypothetical protein
VIVAGRRVLLAQRSFVEAQNPRYVSASVVELCPLLEDAPRCDLALRRRPDLGAERLFEQLNGEMVLEQRVVVTLGRRRTSPMRPCAAATSGPAARAASSSMLRARCNSARAFGVSAESLERAADREVGLARPRGCSAPSMRTRTVRELVYASRAASCLPSAACKLPTRKKDSATVNDPSPNAARRMERARSPSTRASACSFRA